METSLVNEQTVVDKCRKLLDRINNIIDNRQKQDQGGVVNGCPDTACPNTKVKDPICGFELAKAWTEDERCSVYRPDRCGTALVQSFYGIDPGRIAACSDALCRMLKSKPLPVDWVFVEGQMSKRRCAFSWLQSYGVKYVFVKLGKAQEHIFLERVLWNIGAAETDAVKLCFMDADIWFRNDDWLFNVDRELDNYDVVQPFETAELEDSPGRKYTSLAKTLWDPAGFEKSCGHAGLGLAMTRKCFGMLRGFEPAVTLDDIWTWTRILGEETFRIKRRWMPCRLPAEQRNGLPVDVGYARNECFHVGEKGGKYKILTDVWKNRIDGLSDIFEYDARNPSMLPQWKTKSKVAMTIKTALCSVYSGESDDGMKAYFDAAEKIYGKIGSSHSLVVCTAFRQSYQFRTADFIKRVEKFRNSCQDDVIFTVFSDETGFEDIVDIVVPFNSAFDPEKPWLQCKRKDLEFPDRCSVIWLDETDKFPEKFSVIRFDGVRRFSELGNFLKI